MKKGFLNYSLLWLVALGIFNGLAFLLPHDNVASAFWIAYGAVSFAFVLQLISTACFFKKNLLKERAYGIPVPAFCIMTLIVLLAVGVICVLVLHWIVIAVCYVFVLLQYLANIIVSNGSGKKGAATGFIADLKKNTEAIAQKAENAEIKALAEEVSRSAAEADTYSDVALAGVENKILAEMEKLSSAVESGDVEAVKASAKQMLTFIKERNVKCRMLK